MQAATAPPAAQCGAERSADRDAAPSQSLSKLHLLCIKSKDTVPRKELLTTIAIHRNTQVHLLARRILSQGMYNGVDTTMWLHLNHVMEK